VGQVTEIRLLAHLARLRWAKTLISTLITAALLLVANNHANLADATLAVTRVNTVEDDVGQVRGRLQRPMSRYCWCCCSPRTLRVCGTEHRGHLGWVVGSCGDVCQALSVRDVLVVVVGFSVMVH